MGNAITVIRKSRGVNLEDPRTLIGSTITDKQAEQRLKILEVRQNALFEKQTNLSIKSYRELRELAEVLFKDEVQFTVKITREDPDQFYFVRFNLDPSVAMRKKIKKLCARSKRIANYFIQSSNQRMLSTFIEPSEEMKWYNKAVTCGIEVSFSKDFLVGLRGLHTINLDLLSLALYHSKTNTFADSIFQIYFISAAVYQNLIGLNNSYEKELLSYLKVGEDSVMRMCDLITKSELELTSTSQAFLMQCNEILTVERKIAILLSKNMESSLQSFLEQIHAVEEEVEKSIEIHSKRFGVITHILWLYEEVPRQMHLEEEALGEANRKPVVCACQTSASRRRAEMLEQTILSLQASIDEHGNPCPHQLEKDFNGIAAIIAILLNLKSGIKIIRSTAEIQLLWILNKLKTAPLFSQCLLEGEHHNIESIREVVVILEGFFDRIASIHGLWGQILKQNYSAQAVQKSEYELQEKSIHNRERDESTLAESLQNETSMGINPASERLATYEELLDPLRASSSSNEATIDWRWQISQLVFSYAFNLIR